MAELIGLRRPSNASTSRFVSQPKALRAPVHWIPVGTATGSRYQLAVFNQI